MRLFSSLLIATLGGFVGAAPVAPVHVADPVEKGSEQHDEIGRVVLKGDSHRPTVPQSSDSAAAPTLEAAPALRGRRLPPSPSYEAPVRDVRADVRAGLFATPPPGA